MNQKLQDQIKYPAKVNESRVEKEVRWRAQHTWDGPPTTIGWVSIPTCSRCGCDASEQTPCEAKSSPINLGNFNLKERSLNDLNYL